MTVYIYSDRLIFAHTRNCVTYIVVMLVQEDEEVEQSAEAGTMKTTGIG